MQTDIETFCPKNQQEWRKWLEENHASKKAVWLLQYKKKSDMPVVSWSDAVDEALCFGWIDSIRKSVDDNSFIQYFGKRKPNSAWSKINKIKVEGLIEKGLMTKAGFDSIDIAKQNGSWNALDDVEELKIPKDLDKAFKAHKGSKAFFLSLSKSMQKMMLHWIISAKRDETRQKRLNEIVECASQKLKPQQFR